MPWNAANLMGIGSRCRRAHTGAEVRGTLKTPLGTVRCCQPIRPRAQACMRLVSSTPLTPPPSTCKKPALAAGFLLPGNITGALLVQSATGQAGRPITLVVPADLAWVTRAAVNTLHAWVPLPTREVSGRCAAPSVLVRFRAHRVLAGAVHGAGGVVRR